MPEHSKTLVRLSILEFAEKKAREERDSGPSVNNNKNTSKLTNRKNVKDNLTKKIKANDNIKNGKMYVVSESKAIKWQI